MRMVNTVWNWYICPNCNVWFASWSKVKWGTQCPDCRKEQHAKVNATYGNRNSPVLSSK